MKEEKRKRPLWQCPKCKHRFVTANLWHSCGRYSVADHFKGKPAVLRRTFDAYVAAARTHGRVTVYAQKTRIVFQQRVRFAGVVVRKDWVEATMWLRHRVSHPLLIRTESFGQLGFGLHFRLSDPQDIDQAMIDLLGEAYEVGRS